MIRGVLYVDKKYRLSIIDILTLFETINIDKDILSRKFVEQIRAFFML